jgi:raffinose/stachyose/melibiose transport system substrate-binding protein
MSVTRRTGRFALGASALALALVATGCGSDDASGGGGAKETFTIWHYEDEDGALGVAWNAAMEEFKRTHPDVTVRFELKTFDQMQQTAGMILNSDQAPDIMEYNKGNATAGLLSNQGLLTDLSQVAEERGWAEMIGDNLAITARYDQGEMGGETWYGIPNYGEYVLMYYNQDMFDEYGIDVPTDTAGFETALQAFTDEGITPIANAGNDHPASHWLYLLALSQADPQWVRDFQLYEGEVDFHGPEWTHAVETYRDWLDAGYFDKDAVGLTGSDMTEDFVSGRSPILVGGNWWYGGFVNDIADFAWGAAPYPGSDITLGSAGNMWIVPERAKNKQLAYDFIDITMSPEIQALLGNEGSIPIAADPSDIEDERARAVVAGFLELQQNDGLGFYPDWPVPGYYDTLVAATQNLMNGADPHVVLDEIAGPYETHVASQQ